MTLTNFVNEFLGILTILAQAAAIFLAISLITCKKSRLFDFLTDKAFMISFIVSLVAMLGSLTYSDIIGYDPCKFCWFQRILMYPQVILLGMAMIRKDMKIAVYSMTLSIIGAVIAFYHYLLQIGVAPAIPCSAVGYSSACAQRFVMQYGYITIPMMAFSAFLLIALLMYANKRKQITG